MSIQINKAEAVTFLQTHNNYLIYTHNSPDADTLGSACALVLALRKLGKQAFAFSREGIPSRLSFLPTEGIFAEEPGDLNGKTLVSVDVAAQNMLSPEEESLVFALSIDHHERNTIQCERLYVEPSYPAAGEIVFELIEALGVSVDKPIAGALYAAISSDSGGFRYSYTRPQTMRAAAVLMESGIDFAGINRLLFESKSRSQIQMEKLGYEKLELHFGGQFAMIVITQEDLSETGATDSDTECINQLPRQIAGVRISAVLKPKGDKVKCSLRSNEDINVSELASLFGGGGHYFAAGFSVSGQEIGDVRERLLRAVEERLG